MTANHSSSACPTTLLDKTSALTAIQPRLLAVDPLIATVRLALSNFTPRPGFLRERASKWVSERRERVSACVLG